LLRASLFFDAHSISTLDISEGMKGLSTIFQLEVGHSCVCFRKITFVLSYVAKKELRELAPAEISESLSVSLPKCLWEERARSYSQISKKFVASQDSLSKVSRSFVASEETPTSIPSSYAAPVLMLTPASVLLKI
jgi:hypothetical protein